ncbi:MAG: FHA domain-containing protein [Pseudomonadota bacterium]
MRISTTPRLYLCVDNPEALEHGSLPNYRPQQTGATIGSQGADWHLYDSAGSVAASHAAIRWLQGRYVLVDLCGATYINADPTRDDPLGKLKLVALRDGDRLKLGKYCISVHLETPLLDTQAYGADHLRELNLGSLLGRDPTALLTQAPISDRTRHNNDDSRTPDQVLSAFLGQGAKRTSADPLQHLAPLHTPPQPPEELREVTIRLSTDYAADYSGTVRQAITLPAPADTKPSPPDTMTESPATNATRNHDETDL